MAALCNRAGHIHFHRVVSSIFYLFFAKSQPSQIGCLPYFHTCCGLSVNLECRSETCCTQLAENAGCKKSPSRHRRTTLLGYIFATKAHIDDRKKLVKQQCLPYMALQYGKLRSTSSWDLLATLGHPCKFQRVSRLGSITAWHSSIGHQVNFAALNRGGHLYLAGQPSHWALAHISSFNFMH